MAQFKPRYLFAVILAFIFTFGVFFQTAVSANAAEDYRGAAGVIRLVAGEETLLASAVICAVEDGALCFTEPVDISTVQSFDSTTGALVSWKKWHQIEYMEDFGILSLWEIPDFSDETQSPLRLASAKQGMVCTLVYATSEAESVALSGITLGEEVEPNSGLVTITGVGSQQVNYPASIISSSGNIVAIALSENVAFIFATEGSYASGGTVSGGEEEPGQADGDSDLIVNDGNQGNNRNNGAEPSPQNSSLYFLVGAAALIGVLVYFFKKKAPSTSNPKPEYPPVIPQKEENNIEKISPTMPVNSVQNDVNFVKPGAAKENHQICLVVTGGYMMGRIYPVENSEITIGRSPTAGIPYKVESVSKLHCKVYRDSSNRWMLMDCNSRNGTYLKRIGKLSPMQPVEVFPGDIFFLGSPQYSFEIRG